MTPHNEASPGDYAQTVLVAGDPRRVEWMAATFLDDARCVNQVRGALGFTGLFKGRPVSIQSTGMGRPSFTIYVHELIAFYGARILIRAGSCGALTLATPLRDLFVAESAIMDTDLLAGFPALRPDAALHRSTLEASATLGIACHSGPMVCSDTFYHPEPFTRFDPPRAAGITGVDMETANLFSLAHQSGVRAVSICTIVDSSFTGEESALSERPEIFRSLALVGLEVAARA